jgi:dihydrofolate reductase
MKISLIVAAAEDDAIGKGNALLWRLPNDLKFFKNTTWAMPVAMGRKTFESIAGGPLPGRINIVITRKAHQPPVAGVIFVGSLDEAIEAAKRTNCKELFIAGGGDIYLQAMSLATKIYLTRVHAHFPEADVHFRGFRKEDWSLLDVRDFPSDDKHPFSYSFEVWEKKEL